MGPAQAYLQTILIGIPQNGNSLPVLGQPISDCLHDPRSGADIGSDRGNWPLSTAPKQSTINLNLRFLLATWCPLLREDSLETSCFGNTRVRHCPQGGANCSDDAVGGCPARGLNSGKNQTKPRGLMVGQLSVLTVVDAVVVVVLVVTVLVAVSVFVVVLESNPVSALRSTDESIP